MENLVSLLESLDIKHAKDANARAIDEAYTFILDIIMKDPEFKKMFDCMQKGDRQGAAFEASKIPPAKAEEVMAKCKHIVDNLKASLIKD